MSSNSTSNSSTTITNRRGMTPSGSPHSKTFEDKRLDTTSDDSVDEDKKYVSVVFFKYLEGKNSSHFQFSLPCYRIVK